MIRKPWSQSDIEFLKANYMTMTYKAIAKHIGHPATTVNQYVHKFKLPPKHQFIEVIHTYFDDITLPVQAYLLGLLAADGYVGPRGKADTRMCVRLGLRQEDESAVMLLRDEIAPDKRLYYRENVALLDISSKYMVQTLQTKYGIVPYRKPHLSLPALDDDLLPPFILGYFDGDGWLAKSKYGTWTWALMGGKPLMIGIHDQIEANLGIQFRSPYRYENWKQPPWMHRLTAHASNAIQIDKWLHFCGLGMPRKNIALRP